MRGEELPYAAHTTARRELPPHARRRVLAAWGFAFPQGITSACAEKRVSASKVPAILGNYLRMRGEEWSQSTTPRHQLELPPHARRRGLECCEHVIDDGITSACAEKSGLHPQTCEVIGNYLRMRGEELRLLSRFPIPLELPPHARRRVTHSELGGYRPGITSACAEKSV